MSSLNPLTDPSAPGAAHATPPGATHATPPGASQPVAEVLATPVLAGSRVLAGARGLDRQVERLNVMEVPDILPWVKPGEFLLTTAYPLRGCPEGLAQLIADLDDAGLAGIGVKLGRYLDEVPAAALEVADARGFPLVQLPDGVGFDEIFNEVLTGILNRHARALARSERIHRAFLQLVLRGQGLPEIVRDLADLVDRPAAIVGVDGRILAAARLEEASPAQPLVVDGATVIEVGPRVVRIDNRTFAAVTVPIVAGLRQHGHVVALAGTGAPTGDLQALETAATVAALALTKQLEIQAVEDKYRSDLVHDLLREVEDPTDALRRAAGFGWDLDRRLIAMVLRLDRPSEPVVPDEVTRRPPLASAVQRTVLERDPGAAVVRFSHEVVILTGAFDGDDGRQRSRLFGHELAQQAAHAVGSPVSGGLSRPVTDVRSIAAAYDQAARALLIGRQIHGGGAVAHFDDLGAYRLLSLVEDREELRTFVEEVLGEVATDAAASVDLRHTLEVLLDAGGNVAEAARRLYVHYNTLRYRIEKLESIVGPFTTDARTRLDVQIALLVLSMKGLDDRR